MKQLAFIFLLLCQLGFSQNAIPVRKSGIIFTEDYKYYAFDYFKRFTPSSQEIQSLEKILKSNIQNKFIRRNLGKYKRQYIGFYNIQGERVILINFLWKGWTDYDFEGNEIQTWKKEWMEIQDGGNHYWKIKYNPDTKSFYEMNVNGVG